MGQRTAASFSSESRCSSVMNSEVHGDTTSPCLGWKSMAIILVNICQMLFAKTLLTMWLFTAIQQFSDRDLECAEDFSMTEHGTQFKWGIHADLDFRRWIARPRVLLNTCRKDEIRNNIQKYGLGPFNDSLIYVYRFVARLAFSTVGLYHHMEASEDTSETKSEISCVNGLREIVNTSRAEVNITYR
jgi:hypothetical protein